MCRSVRSLVVKILRILLSLYRKCQTMAENGHLVGFPLSLLLKADY